MRRHKMRAAWFRLYKDATSRVSDEPKIRPGSMTCLREYMLDWEYPFRRYQRSWKKHRKTQFKR